MAITNPLDGSAVRTIASGLVCSLALLPWFSATAEETRVDDVIFALKANSLRLDRSQIKFSIAEENFKEPTGKLAFGAPLSRVTAASETRYDGQRRIELRPDGDLVPGVSLSRDFAFDGNQVYRHELDRESGAITSSQKIWPMDFRSFTHWFDGGLDHVLEEQIDRCTIEDRAGENPGQVLTAIRWHDPESTETVELLLDPQWGYQPVRITHEIPRNDLLESAGVSLQRYTVSVDGYQEVDGVIVPTNVTHDFMFVSPDGREIPINRQSVRVDEVIVDIEKPSDDRFRIEFPYGTPVALIDLGLVYISGEVDNEAIDGLVAMGPDELQDPADLPEGVKVLPRVEPRNGGSGQSDGDATHDTSSVLANSKTTSVLVVAGAIVVLGAVIIIARGLRRNATKGNGSGGA